MKQANDMKGDVE